MLRLFAVQPGLGRVEACLLARRLPGLAGWFGFGVLLGGRGCVLVLIAAGRPQSGPPVIVGIHGFMGGGGGGGGGFLPAGQSGNLALCGFRPILLRLALHMDISSCSFVPCRSARIRLISSLVLYGPFLSFLQPGSPREVETSS